VDHLTTQLLAARDGDPDALDAFIRATQAEVWRFCAHLVGRDAADDVTQDTYTRAVRSVGRFRGESSARTWLLVIARRAAADHVRRVVRGRRLQARLTTLQPPDRVASAQGGEVELRQLIATLPVEQREAFVLTQVLGLAYAETAVVLDCPIGTVRSRVARARAALAAAAGDTPLERNA
jgi:RNA polymerase sigma-70 factor (ECF subfamily)